MKRRQFLIGGAVTLLSGRALAQTNVLPGYEDPARPWEFGWGRPGVAKYSGDIETACRLLLADQKVPAEEAAALCAKARLNRPDWSEDLPRNYRTTRMLFTLNGKHVVVTNVVAVTDKWPKNATRRADFYRVRGKDGKVYLLIRPHVCGNWSLAIMSLQGKCIPDPQLCGSDTNCETLRRLQA